MFSFTFFPQVFKLSLKCIQRTDYYFIIVNYKLLSMKTQDVKTHDEKKHVQKKLCVHDRSHAD
jgi:hypothetical protein